MKRNGLVRLMAAMVAVALACGVLASCDDDDDDDGPSVVQTIKGYNVEGATVFTANFYSNLTWNAFSDGEEVMRGTYVGTPSAGSTVTVKATLYLGEDGWVPPSYTGGFPVRIDSDGYIDNTVDMNRWLDDVFGRR